MVFVFLLKSGGFLNQFWVFVFLLKISLNVNLAIPCSVSSTLGQKVNNY